MCGYRRGIFFLIQKEDRLCVEEFLSFSATPWKMYKEEWFGVAIGTIFHKSLFQSSSIVIFFFTFFLIRVVVLCLASCSLCWPALLSVISCAVVPVPHG